MGFGSFIGSIGLMDISGSVSSSWVNGSVRISQIRGDKLDIPLGIGMLLVALILFAYGWYLYKSGYPRGTLNVHNQ